LSTSPDSAMHHTGPVRLSASSISQFRGTALDDWFTVEDELVEGRRAPPARDTASRRPAQVGAIFGAGRPAPPLKRPFNARAGASMKRKDSAATTNAAVSSSAIAGYP